MPNGCCVPLCNRSEKTATKLSFHRFPPDDKEKRTWLKLIRRANFTPTHNSRVCSWHFPNGRAAGPPTRFSWNEGKTAPNKAAVEMLESHPDWHPSLHLGYRGVNASSVARFERRMKRQQAALLRNRGHATALAAALLDQRVKSRRPEDISIKQEPENVSIKQEPEEHPHLNQSVASSSLQVQMSSPAPASAVSQQLFLMVYQYLVNKNDQSVQSSQQVNMSSPASAETVSIQQEPDCWKLKSPVEKRNECDKCGKVFKTGFSLYSHRSTHTGEKERDYQSPIQQEPDCWKLSHKLPVKKRTDCDQCGKIFKTSLILQRHLMSHQTQLCDECGKLVAWNSLKRHQLIHTGEKPYQCVQCAKRFRSKINLKTHMKHHTGEKPYQCHKCEKAFSTRGNLRTHLRIHTGEKPYVCNLCGERFSISTTLKSHQRDHARNNQYRCEVCSKSFNTRSELKTHKRTHMGEKPDHCESSVQPDGSLQKAP